MKNFIILCFVSIMLYSCSESPVSPVNITSNNNTNTFKNKDFKNNSDLFLTANTIAEISVDEFINRSDKENLMIFNLPLKNETAKVFVVHNYADNITINLNNSANNLMFESASNITDNIQINTDISQRYYLQLYCQNEDALKINDKIYVIWNQEPDNSGSSISIYLNNCENCTFVNTSFYQTYSNINYNGSTFYNCYFGNAVMQNCTFQNTLFRNNEMATSQFQTSDFTNADFFDNTVYDCVFYDTCIFISATVTGGSFGACGFIDNLMQGISFKPTSVYATNFGGCNLQSANMVNYSSLMQDSAVSFIGCDLSYAQVVKYNLSHSNLSGSNFTFTNFMFSNLSYANIGASTFYSTNLNNANMCNVTGSPFVFKFVSQIGTQCPYKL